MAKKTVQHRAKKPKPANKPTSPSKRRPLATTSSGSAASHQAPDPTPLPHRDVSAQSFFRPEHRILLVGDGDISFAAALAVHHGCSRVTATVPETDAAALAAVHPTAATNAAAVARVEYGVDARRRGGFAGRPFDRIAFNFPHVGGRSTDVNRQVRHNQELVAGFLARAAASLAPRAAVCLTLFDAAPYTTLWNVRDLARHAGLRPAPRSFRFRPDLFPGYRHARTCGVVRARRGTGPPAAAPWRGELRPARCFVFVRPEDNDPITGAPFDPIPEPLAPARKRKRKRRPRGQDSSESESDPNPECEEDEHIYHHTHARSTDTPRHDLADPQQIGRPDQGHEGTSPSRNKRIRA